MNKPRVKIEDWSTVTCPCCQVEILFGRAYGHPRIEDGHRVLSSAIVVNNSPLYIETRNTIYDLGTFLEESYKSSELVMDALNKEICLDRGVGYKPVTVLVRLPAEVAKEDKDCASNN